jgi:hypothetical protein
MNYANVAARVAADKMKYPHLFCTVRGCLWRTVSARTGHRSPCQKHPKADYCPSCETPRAVHCVCRAGAL